MTQNGKNAKTPKVQNCQNWCIHAKIFSSLFIHFMNIPIKIEIERLNISRFKAFVMINLQYEIRICQIIYYKVTMIAYVWSDLTCITP